MTRKKIFSTPDGGGKSVRKSKAVDVGVVLCKPGVSQDDCLMVDTRDIEFRSALVTLVLDNEIDCFSDFSGNPSALYSPIRCGSLKLMCSDKLVVNKFSC